MTEPMLDLAHGDRGTSRQLARALHVLLSTSSDPSLQSHLKAVLEGKGSARELLQNPALSAVLDRTMPAALQQFAHMSDDERARLAALGEAERQRSHTAPLDSEPIAARRDRDDTSEDDDRYFRQRNQGGWLV